MRAYTCLVLFTSVTTEDAWSREGWDEDEREWNGGRRGKGGIVSIIIIKFKV